MCRRILHYLPCLHLTGNDEDRSFCECGSKSSFPVFESWDNCLLYEQGRAHQKREDHPEYFPYVELTLAWKDVAGMPIKSQRTCRNHLGYLQMPDPIPVQTATTDRNWLEFGIWDMLAGRTGDTEKVESSCSSKSPTSLRTNSE